MTKRWRVITRIVVFLLLGAIVNVAVAWGLAAWQPIGGSASITRTFASLGFSRYWSLQRFDHTGTIRFRSFYCYGTTKTADTDQNPVSVMFPGGQLWDVTAIRPMVHSQIECEVIAGWPMLSLSGLTREEQHGTMSGQDDRDVSKYAIRLHSIPAASSMEASLRLLPLLPIWPGFAINTIFYAVLLWLLWITPGKIRRYRTRRRRMREHRCLACNYQIAEGVGPNCSECGAKLPVKWTANPR
jgi:hypothetical protein